MAEENSAARTALSVRHIDKLESGNYLTWKREMILALKMAKLWTWTNPEIAPARPRQAGQTLTTWTENNDLICAAIQSRCDPTAIGYIEDLTTAAETWSALAERFKPRGSGMLDGTFTRLETLNLGACLSLRDYTNKFNNIASELNQFGSAPDLWNNFLIHRLHAGLSSKYDNYKEQYLQNHDPFNDNGKAKYDCQHAINRLNQSYAAEANSATETALVATGRSQLEQQGITSNSNTRTITKKVKHCTHCGEDYHERQECWILHPDLKPPNKRDRSDFTNRGGGNRRGGRGDRGRGGGKGRSNNEGSRKKGRKNESQNSDGTDEEVMAAIAITASALATTNDSLSDVWVLDSGCTQHMTHNHAAFTQYTNYTTPRPVRGVGGTLTAKGIGTVRLECVGADNMKKALVLVNVLYLPDSGVNLISQGQIDQNDRPIRLKAGTIFIGKHGIRAERQSNNLYVLRMWKRPVVALAALNQTAQQMWHERLGHLGMQNLKRLASMSTGMDLTKAPDTMDPCPGCVIANMKCEPHNTPVTPGRKRNDLIWMDLMGPIEGVYIFGALDDWSKLSKVEILPDKKGPTVLGAVKRLCNDWTTDLCDINRFGFHRLHSDNGGEFLSGVMADFCAENGITQETTIPGTPQMNGAAERLNETLHRKAATMLEDSGLPKYLAPELIVTANYLRIRSPVTGRDKTPYEIASTVPPKLDHLRRIGQWGFAQEVKDQHGWKKFKGRGFRCRLVGYEGDRIYRMLTSNGKIIRCSNVKWIFAPPMQPIKVPEGAEVTDVANGSSPKKQKTDIPPPVIEDDIYITVPKMMAPPPLDAMTSSHTLGNTQDSDATGSDPAPSTQTVRGHGAITRSKTGRRVAPPIPSDPDAIHTVYPGLRSPSVETSGRELSPIGLLSLVMLSRAPAPEPFEPRSYDEAMAQGQEKEDWNLAMQDEVRSLTDNSTWNLVALPPNRKALRGKWVYKLKRGAGGEILRYKARWVVRGFEQKFGIDYFDTFASVVKPMSYKALFAIAAALDWEVEQMDVKTAFLYGLIDEVIYVEQPTGYDDGTDRVCRLNRALYGLKQSPRVWYLTLAAFLETLGFWPLTSDCGVFTNGEIIIACYVDDLLLAGPNLTAIRQIKKRLSQAFQMTDLGPCKFYLGMQVIRDRQNRTIKLSQKTYLEKVLRDFDMWESKPNITPMETAKPEAAPEGYVAMDELRHWYQSAVGSLMYAMLGTRPDLAFAVSVVSRYGSNPTETHKKMVKRIFRYLRGSMSLGLVYKGPLGKLSGFSDADWAGDVDTRRSTSGYIFNIGSGAISWSSKRQQTVALSSCEAEYMGQTQASKEALWLGRLLEELNPPGNSDANSAKQVPPEAVIIFCDNQGAIALAKNPSNHARSKHIDIQHHFVREAVQNGQVQLDYIPTDQQVADGLTKPLPKDKFLTFRQAVGLEEII